MSDSYTPGESPVISETKSGPAELLPLPLSATTKAHGQPIIAIGDPSDRKKVPLVIVKL